MRENRVIEQNRCYHLISWRAHRAFFLKDEGLVRVVALMRRVEAGVKASMSYCIDRAVAVSTDPLSPLAYDPRTGRLATMLAAGSEPPFAWSYLDGSDLKSSLSYPNGLAASWQYDAHIDFCTRVCFGVARSDECLRRQDTWH